MANLLFSPSGRIGPSAFLKGVGILAAIRSFIALIPLVNLQLASFLTLASIILFVPLFFLVVKRLHDSGKSGWMSALFVILMIIVVVVLQGYVVPKFGGVATNAMTDAMNELALAQPSIGELIAATAELAAEYGEDSAKELAVPKAVVSFLGTMAGAFVVNLILKQDAHENQYGHPPAA